MLLVYVHLRELCFLFVNRQNEKNGEKKDKSWDTAGLELEH